MKKTNLVFVLSLFCLSITSFGQVFSGSISIDVKAKLATSITVTKTLLDFQRTVTPATRESYYHVQGNENMFSSSTGKSSVFEAQIDFEEKPNIAIFYNTEASNLLLNSYISSVFLQSNM